MTVQATTQSITQPKIGTWKGSWHLLRASWSTLKMGPEIIGLQVLSTIAGLILTLALGLLVWLVGDLDSLTKIEAFVNNPSWFWVIPAFLYWATILAVGNFFLGAVVAAVLERFAGNQLSIGASLEKARAKTNLLLQYSLFMATIGTLFQLLRQAIEDSRLPFVGKIVSELASMLAQGSLNLVSIFAVPVIMASKEKKNPIQAIRDSAQLFGKVWGQEITGGINLGLIYLLSLLPIFGLAILSGILVAEQGIETLFVTLPLLAALTITISMIMNTLNVIYHVALFQFAQTGESPDQFDKNLLLLAFKPKKRWFA